VGRGERSRQRTQILEVQVEQRLLKRGADVLRAGSGGTWENELFGTTSGEEPRLFIRGSCRERRNVETKRDDSMILLLRTHASFI
jgi:hypothetical protein